VSNDGISQLSQPNSTHSTHEAAFGEEVSSSIYLIAMRKDPSGMRQVLGGWLGQEAVLRPNLTIPDFQKKKKSPMFGSLSRETPSWLGPTPRE
jgi:hypothetical protein